MHKKLNGNVLPPITLNADVYLTNKNYTNIRYALTEVESDYTSWFVNTDPVIEKTNPVVFKKYE